MQIPFVLSAPEKKVLTIIQQNAASRKKDLFLVGGLIRDALLRRESQEPDFDLCLKEGAIAFARPLAKQLKAGFVVLDKEHGACRIVVRLDQKNYTLDFTDFRAKTLEKDLCLRDFTINAIGLSLKEVLAQKEAHFVDPTGGMKDLRDKIIRVPGPESFAQDPLRIVRAFSFSAALDFAIEPKTLRMAHLQRKKLPLVSLERIRDEFFRLFEAEASYKRLVSMDECGILKVIIPEIKPMRNRYQGPYHHLDIWKHTLETIKKYEELLGELARNCDIQEYLRTPLSRGRTRRALIKLGALLHDIGKPAAQRRRDGKIKFHGHERIGMHISKEIAKRLKLSNDEIRALEKMVMWHLRPGYLGDTDRPTARAVFRYFRDTQEEAVSTLLLSIADQRATRGRLTTKAAVIQHERVALRLIKEYFRRKKEKKPARLINGDEVMHRFRLSPSPLVGKILSEIEEQCAIGKITTKKEALLLGAKIIAAQQRVRQ
ncbi:MAG: HD domain-containing protein [Candidatus Omnitrophica bacterium]|nr:HD domain-containing protein [Candidatus Omnitrophota bacterium]